MQAEKTTTSMINTMNIRVELPHDLLGVLDVPEAQVAHHLRELIALELYREQRISAGKGAEMLGISQRQFAQLLKQHDLSYFTESPDELEDQVMAIELISAVR